ncbi:DNA topoisomerase 3 [Lacticaseibacillus baoqingensis]|uniref:DNA topoisomerase n=1 Tax=Lacticaseibacillus baoqingensis TaxID=2486013 RepID=A0ABW4E677_9LACO|nr:DNA topoisomerase 3 [Lacticaseibacillus baoqingensis]
MKLVLAEKPSVGQELARVLKATQKQNGYYEGNGYLVTWSLGHLLTLKMPEQYHPEWAEWTFDTLPMIPEKLAITPLKETRKQLAVVKHLAKRADIEYGIIATDAGREGELVARYIFDYLEFKRPLKRLWISSQTDAAIRDGFAHLRPAAEFEHLYQAALARAEADWLVGLNVSRALTVKYHDSLSAGRVQTPTLAFVAAQEAKIAHFKPQTFYKLNVATPLGTAVLAQQLTQTEAEQLRQRLTGQPLTVVKATAKQTVEQPPLPYDLNELQQAANQQYDFSPKQTLNVLQRLYEREKLVTYPRTDSRYLTHDLEATMGARLQAMGRYSKTAAQLSRHPQAPAYIYNDAKVGDHYGLIPTEQAVDPLRLEADELKIYRLIAERFMDLFKPAYQAEVITYTLKLDTQTLKVKTTSVQEPGFKATTPSTAPKLAVGATLQGQITIKKQQTTPPARLNEATLLGKMDHYGLGTPATRADIIDKLQHAGSMSKHGRELVMTPKGQSLLKLVNPDLVSPDLTARWEAQLQAIEKGQTTRPVFINEIKAETKRLVLAIKQSTTVYQDPNLTQKKCPECGHRLRERPTKVGVKLQCSNPECHYSRFRDPKVTNHRCSQCHKKMVILSGAKGDYFKCQNCGNTEQMSAAKGGRHARVNKREQQQLLKQYSKAQAPEESPLAAALKAAMAKK